MHVLKPHQVRGVEGVMALPKGEPICLASPTGGGKTRQIMELIQRHRTAVIYSDRSILVDQLIDDFEEAGIVFGVRSAKHKDRRRMMAPIQISSIQTEKSRVLKRNDWELHKAELVVADEGHRHVNGDSARILNMHAAMGAKVVLPTATPIEMSHFCKHLVVAGTNSELRNVGMHVLCHTFEPGTLDVGKMKTGEFTDGDVVKEIWTPAVFGKILEHYHKLNPEQRHCIVRCPSVATSVWMSEQFNAAGVSAASLDGEEIVVNGERIKSERDERALLMERFQRQEIRVICFRDVLREGWDFPELYHLILASPISSLTTYVQVVGRLLRAHPSLNHVILQDHGGNYLRHGSPNADRDWNDLWTLPTEVITGERIEQFREKKKEEPIVCPQCYASRNGGMVCHHCGYRSPKKTREIIQSDGTLREAEGDVYKPKRIKVKPDNHKKWMEEFMRCKNSGRTFNQAYALFNYDHHYYPPRDLPGMPRNARDWWQRCDAQGVQLIQRDEHRGAA